MTPMTGYWFTIKPIETQNMGKAWVKFTVPEPFSMPIRALI
jgi:hypothetical protein